MTNDLHGERRRARIGEILEEPQAPEGIIKSLMMVIALLAFFFLASWLFGAWQFIINCN